MCIRDRRLLPELAMDVHDTVAFEFSDTKQTVTLTIRRGIAEYAMGTPLPGTPTALATAKTDTLTWKRLALGLDSPASAVLSGRLKVDNLGAFQAFMKRFRRGA